MAKTQITPRHNERDIVAAINSGQRALRSLQANVAGIDRDKRTVKLAFSSERAEVLRCDWMNNWVEILGHDAGEVRLDRLNGGAALLVNHETDDQVGVIESAQIDSDGVGRAMVRFGKSPRADEIFNDVADGIRKLVSVGYIVHAARCISYDRDTDLETWRVTDWEPYEISFVAVPADPSVGPNRSFTNTVKTTPETRQAEPENKPIPEEKMAPENQTPAPAVPVTPASNIAEIQAQARAAENKRVAEILDLASQYNARDLGDEYARNPSGTIEGLQRALLERQGKSQPVSAKNSDIGMSERDLGKFSFMKIIRTLANPGDRRLHDDAGFEREISQEAAKHQNNTQGGYIVPSDVLMRGVSNQRDMNLGSNGQTGAGNTGAATVATNLLSGSYIEALRKKAVLLRGTRSLGGLVGNVDIPKQTSITNGYWIGEGENAKETQMDFGGVSLSPKTTAAYAEVTRMMLKQSSLDVESLIRDDLARAQGLSIDLAGYYGKKEEKKPTGIFSQDGVQKVTVAGAFPTYGELVDMETAIALKDADADTMRFKARYDLRGYAKQTPKLPATSSGIVIWEPGNTLNGYPVDLTNQLELGDFVFGDFNQMLVGLWGGLEITVDPYSLSKSGSIRVVTFQDIDLAIRHPEAFIIGKAGTPKTPATYPPASE